MPIAIKEEIEVRATVCEAMTPPTHIVLISLSQPF
jgi:hypothetical protein